MKRLLACIFSVMACSVCAKHVVITVSPHHTQETAVKQFSDIVSLYTKLELGDMLTVINGEDGGTITTITIPNKKAYQHPKTKVKYARASLAKLKVFTQSVSVGNRIEGAMDIPKILHQIARNYPDASDIMLMGISPLYHEAGLNMALGHVRRVPSDGFILARATDSPFGTKNLETLLTGKRIHWQLAQDTSNDSMHLEALTRFYHLYIHSLGGKLVSFTGNANAVTRLLLNGAEPLPMRYTLSSDDKLEMLIIREFVHETSLYSQPTSDTPAPKALLDTKQGVSIGIEWDARGVDLDLYAQSKAGEEIYFSSVPTAEVEHYKDIVSGSDKTSTFQYETIQYHKAIDLNALVIVVNAYDVPTSTRVINGTLRLQIAGETYATSFQFRVKDGNKGADAKAVLSGEANSPHSIRFNAVDVFGHSEVSL